MKHPFRFAPVIVLALAGFLLAACASIPPGLVVHVAPDGQSAQVQFIGRVDSMGAGQWTIGGHAIQVNSQTSLSGEIATGDMVQVVATATRDGNVVADSIALAAGNAPTGFDIAEGLNPFETATVTPTPDGTTTGTPEATATPEPTEEPEKAGKVPAGGELELTGSVTSIAPDQWVISGLTFLIDDKTKIDGSFSGGDLVHVHARVNADGSFTAVEIGTAGADASVHGHLEFTGVVRSIDAAQWTVNGIVLMITVQTNIHASPAVGDTVKVEATVNSDGTLTADVIQPLKDFGGGDGMPLPGGPHEGHQEDGGDSHGGFQGTLEPAPNIQFPPFWGREQHGDRNHGNH